MKKRWLAMLMALVLLLTAAGCSQPAQETGAGTEEQETVSQAETQQNEADGRDEQTQVVIVGAGGAGDR